MSDGVHDDFVDSNAPVATADLGPTDNELIAAVRGGNVAAYGTLFERHRDSANRLARQLVSAGDVDDLVSESFSKVLDALQKGGGPDTAFRAYLLTSMRRLHIDKMRAASRVTSTDDVEPYAPAIEFDDTAVHAFENNAASRAFQSLPERWQLVLWHLDVEGQKPADIAPLLGMSANSVSALAYRAREGLKQAFVSQHAQTTTDETCQWVRENLGAYVRKATSKRDGEKIKAHLDEHEACEAIYLELAEVNSNIGLVLAPVVLGTSAAAYLVTSSAAKAGIVLFFTRAKDWVLHNPAGRMAGVGAGVAAAAAIAAGLVLAHHGSAPINVATPGANPTTAAPIVSTSDSSDAPSASPSNQPTPPATTPTKAVQPKPATSPVVNTPPPPPPSAPSTPPPTKTAEQPPLIYAPLAPVTTPSPGGSVVLDLTAGARDPNGDPLVVVSASAGHGTIDISVAVGRLGPLARLVAKESAPIKVVTYTPQPGWAGPDTVAYTLADGRGGRVSGTVTVITPDAPPVALDSSLSVNGSRDGLSGALIDLATLASDPNPGDVLTYSISGGALGSTSLAGSVLTYSPNALVGLATDTLTYTVDDGQGQTATGTITVNIGPLPYLPPPPPPPPALSGNLALHFVGASVSGYTHAKFAVGGLPDGAKATFTLTINNITGPSYSGSTPRGWEWTTLTANPVDCGLPSGGTASSPTSFTAALTLSCTITGTAATASDSAQVIFLHMDYLPNASADWTATLTADASTFTDSSNIATHTLSDIASGGNGSD